MPVIIQMRRNMKKKSHKAVRKTYKKCVRCGAVGMISVEFGKLKKLWLCSICWVGLAACMSKDFAIFQEPNTDFIAELAKGQQREDWMKQNNK